MKMFVKKLDSRAKIPVYAHQLDAGLDLFSRETMVLRSGERRAVKTGFCLQIEKGYVGLIWDKSGRALKEGVKTMAGVIDSGYRGEVQVVLVNLGEKDVYIKSGEKIAQLLIQPVVSVQVVETNDLDNTFRGEDGFGSTGL